MSDLSTPDHAVEKIPDFILLKKSREEIGQLKAEIDYLQSELEKLKNFDKKELQAIRKERVYVEINKRLSDSQKTVAALRKENERLLCQILQLKLKAGEI